MKNVAIVGGGMAGLSAAIHLIRNGFNPIIFESTGKGGGRTSSFYDSNFNSNLDNGQHILMGCYRETINLFSKEQLNQYFQLEKSLSITYLGLHRYKLKAPPYCYPINLVLGILRYKALSMQERIMVLFFMIRVFLNVDSSTRSKSVLEWLVQNNQSQQICDVLWAPLAIGALNTSLERADASLFKKIIKQIFFTGNFASTIVIPKFDLLRSLVEPLSNRIIKNGGEITYSTAVKGITSNGRKIMLTLISGEIYESEAVIFAIPYYALKKINNIDEVIKLPKGDFTYSAILSVHLKVSQHNLKENFVGMLCSPVHWVFNKGEYLSVVISDADAFKGLSDSEIMAVIIPELEKHNLVKKEHIVHVRIVLEKRATFIPEERTNFMRLHTTTNNPLIFLAGDWTNTGLPATIEGAVLSGRKAAEEVKKYLKN